MFVLGSYWRRRWDSEPNFARRRARNEAALGAASSARYAHGFSSPPPTKKEVPTARVRTLFLAEAVGFEPTGDFTRHSISSRDRYDHFDTPPYGKHEREAELSNARYYTIKNLKKQPFFEKKLEIIFADARKSFCVSEKGIFLFNLNF